MAGKVNNIQNIILKIIKRDGEDSIVVLLELLSFCIISSQIWMNNIYAMYHVFLRT